METGCRWVRREEGEKRLGEVGSGGDTLGSLPAGASRVWLTERSIWGDPSWRKEKQKCSREGPAAAGGGARSHRVA